MSYKCDKCDKVRYGNELNHIAEVRDVTYNRVFERFDRRENKKVTHLDATFNGTEIVKEETLCEECFEKVKDNPPKHTNRKAISFVGIKKRDPINSDRRDKNNDRGRGRNRDRDKDEDVEELDINGLKEKFENRR